VGNLFEMADSALLDDIEIWSVGLLPVGDIPAELALSIREKRRVVTIEEHYSACGLGEALSHLFLTRGVVPESFQCLHAAGYPSGRYGSQRWHQQECGLAGDGLVARLKQVVHG
jgi:transketolase